MTGRRVIRFMSILLLVLPTMAPHSTASAAEELVTKVSGNGSFVMFKGQPVATTFQFNAERDAIGVVTGQAQFVIRNEPFGMMSASEVEFAVRLSCLAVDGASATLGGTIVQSTASSAPLSTGQQVIWRVIDTGTESGGVDQMSPVFGGIADGYCTTDPLLSGFPDASPATMPRIRSGTINVYSETDSGALGITLDRR